jgi:hypothetical protein
LQVKERFLRVESVGSGIAIYSDDSIAMLNVIFKEVI